MAIAIKSIPILRDKVAKSFEDKLEKNFKKKSTVDFKEQLELTNKILIKSKNL